MGVSPPYVAFVGTLEPRKDVPTLVAAFARLAEGHPDLRLVLAGGRGWGATQVGRAIVDHRVATRVIVTGYVADACVAPLLRGAAVVAYPSLEEGFGLPALEALACGAPLVTTTGSALEEVTGDAALLVGPGDVEALAAALEAALEPETGGRLRARVRRMQRASRGKAVPNVTSTCTGRPPPRKPAPVVPAAVGLARASVPPATTTVHRSPGDGAHRVTHVRAKHSRPLPDGTETRRRLHALVEALVRLSARRAPRHDRIALMPATRPQLTEGEAAAHVRDTVFTSSSTGRLGLELEWITSSVTGRAPAPDEIRSALPPSLPGGSGVSFEPGGQLELSGPACASVSETCREMAKDVAFVRATLARRGIELHGIGLDPELGRPRLVRGPRYDAMEQYFDAGWPAGRTMMRRTAAIQVNVDLGAPSEVDRRWRRAHVLGPILAASFANSPLAHDRPTGWKSARLAAWYTIDPLRTQGAERPGLDAPDAWLHYALDAPVMMIRLDDRHSAPVAGRLPFRRWLAEGHELGWPTIDDFAHHLTTLFPPVRPRGHFELRMIDALPDDWWPVAAAVTATLMDDPPAAAAVDGVIDQAAACWTEATRDGLAAPILQRAASLCFETAVSRMTTTGVDPEIVRASRAYIDRYVAAGRCPADDQLREWARRPPVPA